MLDGRKTVTNEAAKLSILCNVLGCAFTDAGCRRSRSGREERLHPPFEMHLCGATEMRYGVDDSGRRERQASRRY